MRENIPPHKLRFEYWDTLRHERKEIEWLVEGLLPLGVLAVLAHRPFSGGPELAVALGHAVSTGREFAGMKTKMRNALYIAGSRPRDETERMLKALPPDYSDHPMVHQSDDEAPRIGAIPLYVHYGRWQIDKFDTLSELKSATEGFQAGLVIVDNLASCVARKCLMDGRAAQWMMRELRGFVMDTGCTLLLLHHLVRNAGRVRVGDHQEIAEGAMLQLTIEAGKDRNRMPLIRLEAHGGGRYPSALHYLKQTSPTTFEKANLEADIPIGTTTERVLGVLTNFPKTAFQIQGETGIVYGCVKAAVNRLIKSGLAVYGPKKGQKLTYILPS